jgi:hypothetical protein
MISIPLIFYTIHQLSTHSPTLFNFVISPKSLYFGTNFEYFETLYYGTEGVPNMIPKEPSDRRPVRLAYQPPASSNFLSEQTSQQQPGNRTFLSEQTSTSHQPPAKRTG